MNVGLNVVAGFSPRFHNVTVAAPRAKARDYIVLIYDARIPRCHSAHNAVLYSASAVVI